MKRKKGKKMDDVVVVEKKIWGMLFMFVVVVEKRLWKLSISW